MTDRLPWIGLTALGATLAGCLNVPDGPTPMCASTDDCDRVHGEVCEEGVCWGNPPPGAFAVVISPPSTRRDLVPRELSSIVIPDSGLIRVEDLVLDAPVLLSGRVAAFCPPPMTGCGQSSLDATVTVSRRSQFLGGPGFQTVVNIDASGAFSIPVPRTRATEPYSLTIVPDTRQLPADPPGLAQQVPPLYLPVPLTDDTSASINLKVTLGAPGLPVISGVLTNSLGQGLAGYRVVALGRWDPTAPATEVSTVAYTDSAGSYAVTLSDDLVGTVELLARPTEPIDMAPRVIGPTVHVANIDATTSSIHNIDLDNLGGEVNPPPTVLVTGVDSGGATLPVRGALVSVTGALPPVGTPPTSFTYTEEQVTDMLGNATLRLVGGDIVESYRLSITPPAGSRLGVVFDQRLIVGEPKRLPPRVALRGTIGTVVGDAYKPLPNVAVTARPSLRFLWTLDAAPQTFVAAIPPATTVTLPSGEFVLWVDASVAQVAGSYDLVIEPPTTAQAPTYVTEVAIAGDPSLDEVTLSEITLPDAAFVHGTVTGPGGEPIQNADVKLYRVSAATSLCSEVAHAPLSCPIPAQLQGRSTSDANGQVRLTLPR